MSFSARASLSFSLDPLTTIHASNMVLNTFISYADATRRVATNMEPDAEATQQIFNPLEPWFASITIEDILPKHPLPPLPHNTSFEDLPLLHVDNLHPDVTEEDITKIFETRSKAIVRTVVIARDAFSGRSLEFGTVRIDNVNDAGQIVKRLNNHQSLFSRGRRIRVILKNRKFTSRKIIVKNLDPSTGSCTLEKIFAQFGKIEKVDLAEKIWSARLPHAYVTFSTQEAAEEAISRLHGMRFGGHRVFVEHAVKRKRPNRGSGIDTDSCYVRTVCVLNLPKQFDRFALHRHFCDFGSVMYCHIIQVDKDDDFAFLTFSTAEEAKTAVRKMDGNIIKGREVIVQMAHYNHDPFIRLDDASLLARRILEEPAIGGVIEELDFLEFPDFKLPLSGMHQEVILIAKLRRRVQDMFSNKHPSLAERVTCMLSEMGKGRISKLITSNEDLKKQVSVALTVADKILPTDHI